MRALLLLAPLLLSGCGLLLGSQDSSSISLGLGPDRIEICSSTEEPECLVQPTPGDFGDRGYPITCQGVDEEACQEVAERAAAALGPSREARWIIVWPERYDICWEGPSETGCSGEDREPTSP